MIGDLLTIRACSPCRLMEPPERCVLGYSVPVVPTRDFFTIAKGLCAILEYARRTRRLEIGGFI